MGYKITTVAARGPGAIVPVPEELVTELVQLYDHLAVNPSEAAYATFDTADERKAFIRQAKTWAASAGLVFRSGRTKDLPDTELKFFLSVPKTAEQIAAEATARETAKIERERSGKPARGRPANVA
jgi:hypothetical protein